jgi:hypothetical protein
MFDHSGQQTVLMTTSGGGKIKERLAVDKQRSHRFHMERFNLKKLNEVEGKEQCRVEVSNKFTALEDSDVEVEVNGA